MRSPVGVALSEGPHDQPAFSRQIPLGLVLSDKSDGLVWKINLGIVACFCAKKMLELTWLGMEQEAPVSLRTKAPGPGVKAEAKANLCALIC